MPKISADRLLAELGALARIGGRDDGGVDRPAGSEADLAARRWLAGRLQQAGLEGWIDSDQNVIGRAPGSSGPWLLLGSHTDTVPAGGRLDGAYGVIAAWEVLRTLYLEGHPAATRVEVVSFADEEGLGSDGGLTGSRALAGAATVEELTGYLELHIEQGPRLEAEGAELGVVDGIVGIDRWDVTISGAANHAGTTPFALRHDAGRVAARAIADLKEMLLDVDAQMVGNVGDVRFLPGAPNVVPGEARFPLELRALREESLEAAAARFAERLRELAGEEGCTQTMVRTSRFAPAAMNADMVAALERVCTRSGRPWMRLQSGAGHDASSLAARVPAAMLFVPSRGGISHSPLEHTDAPLLVQGAQALMDAALEVLDL